MERTASPREVVEDLFRQVLLEDLVELGDVDQTVRYQDLSERLPGGGALAESLMILLIIKDAPRHHELPKGVLEQVGMAVDRNPVLENDLFFELPSLDTEDYRAFLDGERL